MSDDVRYYKFFIYFFLLGYFIIWGLIPSLFLHSIFPDTAQNLAWGHTWSWGYDSHPALGAWVITTINMLFHNNEFSAYFAGAGCLTVALWFTYKIARFYLSFENAVAATLLSSLSYYYLVNFVMQYNQNTIMQPFWLATIYFFIKALKQNKTIDWILLSIVAALSMMAKYESAIILFLECIYLFSNFYKKYFLNLIMAVVLFFVLLFPNIYWVFSTHFLPIKYALSRGGLDAANDSIIVTHLLHPLTYFIIQPLNLFLSIVVLYCSIYKKWLSHFGIKSKLLFWHPLIYFSITPLIFVCVISFLSGAAIQAEWGFPLLSLFLVGIFYYWQITVSKLKMIFIVCLVIHAIILSGFMIGNYLNAKPNRLSNPSYTLANTAESYWEKIGLPKNSCFFIGGDAYFTGVYLTAYLPSKPAILVNSSLYDSPWINRAKFLKSHGMLIVGGCDKTARDDFKQKFSIASFNCISVPTTNKIHPIELTYTLYIVSPRADVF